MTNELLRHVLATIAYRFQKAVVNRSPSFEGFKIGENTRTPVEILHHMRDLMDKTSAFASDGNFERKLAPQPLLNFEEEYTLFLESLTKLDSVLVKKSLDLEFTKLLLQGPLLDVMTHVGQIAMLCGLNGNRVKGKNFLIAEIKTGKIIYS